MKNKKSENKSLLGKSAKDIIIETERLVLRYPHSSDIPSLIKNINNLKVSQWLLVVPYPYKKKDATWWINTCKKDSKLKFSKTSGPDSVKFFIELKSEKKIIGGMGLSNINYFAKTAEVGYWLGESYWRFGYGSEALAAILEFGFNTLKMRRIQAGVFAENPSSGKLLDKFGFQKEGTLRKAVRCKADGKIKDEIIYGLLKEDYSFKQ